MRLTGPPLPPPRHATLVHALRAAAPHASGVTFVGRDERETFLPWGEVLARAEGVAGGLAARGVAPGDRVAIVLRTEPAFLDAFFGAWLAGAVPVPLYPPVRLGRLDEYTTSTARMLHVSGARLAVSSGALRRVLGEAIARAAPALGDADVADLAGPAPAIPEAAPGDLALVQFSSGSTVDPKPVALRHAALTAQITALQHEVDPSDRDAMVSWLPLYHDMGLVGALLGAVSWPGPLALVAPEHFLARPALWLRAVARHRGTLSPAPSFAFAYCADRVRDADLEGCSLASWRFALDGAEPVSGDALRRFAARFAPHGLDPASLVPVYGLSEATLAVTFSRRGRPLEGRRVDAVRLARDGVLAPGSREIVPVGTPVPGVEVEVRVQAQDGRGTAGLAGEGRLGRIFVRGPSLLAGYLGDPEGTSRALAGGWLDTGDLGFVADGALHVHGRAKDVVIVRGANHAPDEFEAALDGVDGLRPGCAVALGHDDGQGEGLVVLAERAREARAPDAALADAIRHAVTERTGIAPREIRVLAPGTLPRTSSGKLRRQEALRRMVAGGLAPPGRGGALALLGAMARSAVARWRAP
ncbi:MAG: AMP-binding protein [Anaeromyxobacteraceae bacterium]